MQCAYHPDRDPVGACVVCGRLICTECKTLVGGKIYCSPCADRVFINKTESIPDSTRPAATAAPTQTYAAPPPVATSAPAPINITVNNPPAAPASSAVNNSGQGSGSTFPAELKGWSWGGFVLTWLWGIGNSTWIAFLVLIPALNIIWPFVLGAKGNEWAWQNKKWDSLDHFRRVQGTWKKWGIGLFIAGIVLSILYVIILVVLFALNMASFD